MKRVTACLAVLALVFMVCVLAGWAQNDDDDAFGQSADDDSASDDDDFDGSGFYNSMVGFTRPEQLLPDTDLTFEISVTHGGADTKALHTEWIYQINLQMPSEKYHVYDDTISTPVPLHGGATDSYKIDRWESYYDPMSSSVSWQSFAAATPWNNTGDIREGESMLFSFNAKTDPDGSDGFLWTLFGDMGSQISGITYLSPPVGDDDDKDDDDDDEANDGGDFEDSEEEDSDDDGSGCGC
jgi:hypothetical protein